MREVEKVIIIYNILKIIGIFILCDFLTGVVHWLEDTYWTPETPLIGKWIIGPNWEHHKSGQAFLTKSWWESSWDLICVGVSIVAVAAYFHWMSWEVVLFAFILANANQIHKWAHITRDINKPKIINLLQKCYILQTTKQHGRHHRRPNNMCYCTVSNLMNPILDAIKFWQKLEYLIEIIGFIPNSKRVFVDYK